MFVSESVCVDHYSVYVRYICTYRVCDKLLVWGCGQYYNAFKLLTVNMTTSFIDFCVHAVLRGILFILKVLLDVIDGICIDDLTAEAGYKYLIDRYLYYYALSKWATYVVFPLCLLIVSFLDVYASKM